MTVADSSRGKSSEDILKQIQEQTSKLEAAKSEETTEEEVVEAQEEKETETQEEQQAETSEEVEETAEEETKTESKAKTEAEPSYRIKYKGREVEIPPDKVKDYIQKGYRVEEKLKELNEKEKSLMADMEKADFSKMNEEFVKNLQDNPLGTLMQSFKVMREVERGEEKRQRKIDRAFEKDMSENLPHWNAIQDAYHEYRDEGFDPNIAVAKAERDFFASLYLESKQKGVEEGEKKAALKQKAVIPGGSKKGATVTPGTLTAKDIKSMTSDQMAKALGLKIVKHPDW